jgi:predicted ATPase
MPQISRSSDIPFVVCLIGGPASGKSSVLKAIRRSFSGREVVIVREAASYLLHHNFPRPDGTRERLNAFQDAIVHRQFRLEAAARARARRNRIPVVVCDRGVLDTAAYLLGGLPEFEERYQLTPAMVFKRYDLVVDLATVASVPELYARDQKSSLHLSENIEEALKLSKKTSDLWKQHPRHWHVDLKDTVEEKCAVVIDRLRKMIEKK